METELLHEALALTKQVDAAATRTLARAVDRCCRQAKVSTACAAASAISSSADVLMLPSRRKQRGNKRQTAPCDAPKSTPLAADLMSSAPVNRPPAGIPRAMNAP